ncbi:MAG: hypothetical protein IPM74_07390 [Crocinitomicaceae bacterium]|nr:hypothetical protein [Crocinitomicaceae bacterium]MBK8925723.1 hypothetical protein [Crocinitomicaceae bacterium]
MKKLSKISSAFAIAFAIVSCNKEELTTPNQMSDHQIDYTLDNIPLMANTQDVDDLMKSSHDKDGEKLNKYLYEIGLATRELIKNPEFNAVIIQLAEESGTQTAYLLDLEKESPEFFNQINNNLAEKGLSLKQISDDMTHVPLTGNPDFPETMVTEKYEPAIFIPNLKNVDKSKQPLISPNVETDCTENLEIEDFIVTWYYSNEGELSEIILGEQTARVTSNPLFLLDHASPRSGTNTISILENISQPHQAEDSENRGWLDITHFNSNQLDIKSGYRHEEGINVKSEFCIVGAYSSSGYPAAPVFNENSDHSKKITEVHPNNIGTDIYITSYFGPNYVPTYGMSGFKLFWNTFERDWNRSIKTLGTAINVLYH